MQFDAKQKTILADIAKDPSYPRAISELNALYWGIALDGLSDRVRNGEDIAPFLKQEKSFFNSGLVRELREDAADIERKFFEKPELNSPLEIELYTDWILAVVEKIKENDRAQTIMLEIDASKRTLVRLQRDIAAHQEERKDLLVKALGGELDSSTLQCVGSLVETDKRALENLRIKKAISRGVFFPVSERRTFVEKENNLKKEVARYAALVSHIKNDSEKTALRTLCLNISELFETCIEHEEKILKYEAEITALKDKQNALSPLEIQSRVRSEIEYLRDLIRLCAKRLHGESCSVVRKGDVFFTQKEFAQCLDRVLEFDPRIFHNDRVSFQGKPTFLLVPGNGNALFDWKNNRFIVPLIPPGGNFLGSIASAIIEYRIDVDEEKTLVTSYSKLPHLKGVKSILQIRASLTKDYLAWILSESKGFKIMTKETRAWFEHEIAPGKLDIYCPLQYQSFSLSSDDYRKLLADVESRVKNDVNAADSADLWVGSILNYQQGNFERAFECIKTYVDKNTINTFAFYNLGQIAMKVSRKTEAIAGFAEFCKLNPQSWWATVTQDHLRRLQGG